jgi:hypothetical protein
MINESKAIDVPRTSMLFKEKMSSWMKRKKLKKFSNMRQNQ